MSTKIHEIAKQLVAKGKGILAADQSPGSISKWFEKIGLEGTPDLRREFRRIIFTTEDIEKYISGVILHDETIRQKTSDNVPLPVYLAGRGILPGIKVDKGLKRFPNSPKEYITEGADGLRDRLVEYKEMGAVFAKFRCLFTVTDKLPSIACIEANADILARYAAFCQEVEIVPIVEPEVFMETESKMERFSQVDKKVLKAVFNAIDRYGVDLKGMLLKPTWVHPGLNSGEDVTSEEVASATIKMFKEVLPDDLPGVVFLSGGDSPEESSSHLDKINEINPGPWQLSFSFGRALLDNSFMAWSGKEENVERAQDIFYERVRLDSLATTGDY